MRFSDASRYLQPGDGWVIVDNVTVLLMCAPEENVYRLLSSMAANLRGISGVSMAWYGQQWTAVRTSASSGRSMGSDRCRNERSRRRTPR